MKRFAIFTIFLLVMSATCFAEDYYIKAMKIYNNCLNNNLECTKVESSLSEGINYYSRLKKKSYYDKKAYCELLVLRMQRTKNANDFVNYGLYCDGGF